MNRLTLAVSLATLLVGSSTLQAATHKTPGQITQIEVSDGYLVSLFLVLNGSTDGDPQVIEGTVSKTIVWVNGFATTVTLGGKWSIAIPIASIPNPPDGQAAVVKIKALQEGTNVVLERDFSLSELNQLLDQELTLEWLNQLKRPRR